MSLSRIDGKAEEEETPVEMVLLPSTHKANTIAVSSNNGGPQETLLEEPAERDLDVLETQQERRGRRWSHFIVYYTCFTVCLGFSIVLTGVWPYLRELDPGVSKDMLGWVIAANPIGQMIASPLMGFWGNRAGSNRGAFITSLALFSVGNLLYAILNMFGSAVLAVMIISRFIVGISSANITVVRSYISDSTTVRERTTAVSLISAAQSLGFIIGPALQTALAVAFSKDISGGTNSTGVIGMEEREETMGSNTDIQWNMYTSTGWICCFLGLVNLILFLPCIFKEYKIAAKEAQHQKRATNDETSKLPKPDFTALFGIMITFYFTSMIFVLLETIMVPMCMDLYAWNDTEAITVVGTGLSIAAVITILMYILLGCVSKIIDERFMFTFGVGLMMVAMLTFFPMGSTYPKVKNCTSIDPLTSHINETLSLADTFPHTSRSNVDDRLDYTTREPIVLTTSKSEVPTSMPLWTNSSNGALRRQRRHVSSIEDCDDTGCPPDQEWCLYTPIIEISQMGIASLLAVTGYPVAFTLSGALYSKILGPKPQGLWMGILISTGSFSRATGPIVVSYVYTELGTRWIFGILCGAMLCILLLNCILFKRLVPMNIGKRS